MTIRKILLCGASAVTITIGAATAAFANGADAAPEPTWTGLFVGASVGFGFGSDTKITRPPGPPGPPGINTKNDLDGVIGGAQAGFNFVIPDTQLLIGVVGDIAFAGIKDKTADSPPGPPSVWKTDYDWIATVRARLGMLVDQNTLVYAHGGVAFTEIETQEVGGAGPWAGLKSEHNETGFVIGAGAEMQFSDGISVFAEYSYMDFGGDSKITPAGPPGTLSFDNDALHAIKFGINIKLDGLFAGM